MSTPSILTPSGRVLTPQEAVVDTAFWRLLRQFSWAGAALHLLYIPLFAATAAGIGVGILGRVKHLPSLQGVAPVLARRLAWVALLGFGFYLLLSLGMVWQSGLILLEAA